MPNRVETPIKSAEEPVHIARLALASFLFTFVAARVLVFLIRTSCL